MITKIVDTNIFIRFLTKDNNKLSSRAKTIFQMAQDRKIDIYLDEVVMAEMIWILDSFYKYSKEEIYSQIKNLISQSWIINPRKELIIKTLNLYEATKLSYIDCWILILSKDQQISLETFDEKLKKLAK